MGVPLPGPLAQRSIAHVTVRPGAPARIRETAVFRAAGAVSDQPVTDPRARVRLARVSRLLVLLVAVGLVPLASSPASAPAAAKRTKASAGSAAPQATAAKKKRRRRHRRPGCNKFCRQAGGFGAGPDDKFPVRIKRQKIRVDDHLIAIRARCARRKKCVGAILVQGRVEYGRANLRIPAHETRIVLVGITRKGRRSLRRHHRDRDVYATVPLKNGNALSISRRLTL